MRDMLCPEGSFSAQQSVLAKQLSDFFASDKQVFIVNGHAGTGKTFMLRAVADYLKSGGTFFRLAAPTGRAAKVIARQSRYQANTIHSTIYSRENLVEIPDAKDNQSFLYSYSLRENDDPVNTVYIVDEASMISNIYSEGEYFRFGSGFLLDDLMAFAGAGLRRRRKIVFFGDPAQLPPVNMNTSPALDPAYLQEHFGIDASIFTLTEVVRQGGGSGILRNATHLRSAIAKNQFNSLEIDTAPSDTQLLAPERFMSDYLSAIRQATAQNTIVVAYSNAAVKDYNNAIRRHLLPAQSEIAISDRVILVHNHYNYPQMPLLNGTFGEVIECRPEKLHRLVKLKRKAADGSIQTKEVTLTFQHLVIAFDDIHGHQHHIDCRIISNLLYSDQRDLDSDEIKALYVDFKMRHPQLKPGTMSFKKALHADPFFNALRIKFGYAITCHKAQGGEWENVFLDAGTSMGHTSKSYFRWLYTGITRAKENLFLMNIPQFHPASRLQPLKPQTSTLSNSIYIINDIVAGYEVPFADSDSDGGAFIRRLYLAIVCLLSDTNIDIKTIRHTRFLAHYTFARGSRQVLCQLHYSGKEKVTSVRIATDDATLGQEVGALLAILKGKTIVLPGQRVAATAFTFATELQEQFYKMVKLAADKTGMQIVSISSKAYHEIYKFRKSGFSATCKFWYNDKGLFTRSEIIDARSTGLQVEVNALITIITGKHDA
jgi:hypothetical protein